MAYEMRFRFVFQFGQRGRGSTVDDRARVGDHPPQPLDAQREAPDRKRVAIRNADGAARRDSEDDWFESDSVLEMVALSQMSAKPPSGE